MNWKYRFKLMTLLVVRLPLFTLFMFSGCQIQPNKTNLTLENTFHSKGTLVITTPCYFTGYDTTYICSVFHQKDTVEAHWDIYHLVIEQDSMGGKLIYSATFNPDSLNSDNAQTIRNLEIQYNAEGQYLVVYGEFGTAMITRILAKPSNTVKEIAQFSPQPPEFVDVDNDGEPEILVPQGSVKLDATNYPLVDVYKWDGWQLKLLCTVPYEKRLTSH